ncbi:hypothetical protein [Agaribacterium sp. ZY112]|uniref:hypothetical protein n=1 Tax=Agaribacterium sp. ZY112 TaxID=3233574 RepID=UPI003524EAC3
MDASLVTSLGDVGVPAAIIAAALVTWIFQPIHKKLSLASGSLTLVTICLYVPIELFPKAQNAFSSAELQLEPEKFFVFNELGKTTDFTASCSSGSRVIAQRVISAAQPPEWPKRKLNMNINPDADSYTLNANGEAVGVLTEHTLNNLGLVKASSIRTCSRPHFVASSKKVYVGDSWELGHISPNLGQLRLDFQGIQAGKALVSLKSSILAHPKPASLTIANKSFDSQTFESNYELMVQVREADFTRSNGQQWAAFTVIVSE